MRMRIRVRGLLLAVVVVAIDDGVSPPAKHKNKGVSTYQSEFVKKAAVVGPFMGNDRWVRIWVVI
jgi:hypothetical protein